MAARRKRGPVAFRHRLSAGLAFFLVVLRLKHGRTQFSMRISRIEPVADVMST